MTMPGMASALATERFRQRFASLHPGHFRKLYDLYVSSIGLGTYLGDPDDRTDQLYAEALETALVSGCNLIDTAINYRCQRSERVIGETLERLTARGAIAREELVLCTKGGYLPFDGKVPDDPGRYIVQTFLKPGIIEPDELVAGCHCLCPTYLEHQLSASLRNLRVETVDVYYLHNPEQQLDEVPRETVLARMDEAFSWLEQAVHEGRIRLYGVATWHGLRLNPQASGYLSLSELVELARRIGGEDHHFRIIQLPYNLRMPEAFSFQNQLVSGKAMSVLEAAQALGIGVISSASLLQSQLTRLPAALESFIPGLRSGAQRAIQFVRSTPGVASALVGMKRTTHVEENLELANVAPLLPEQLDQLFARARR